MPDFSQGDVVRVPFPYTNRETEQRRPALVISDGALADGHLLWVAMITSAENRAWPDDIDLADDLSRAGLPAPSVVRTLKIATIETAVAQPLGKVAPATLDAVMDCIAAHLGTAT